MAWRATFFSNSCLSLRVWLAAGVVYDGGAEYIAGKVDWKVCVLQLFEITSGEKKKTSLCTYLLSCAHLRSTNNRKIAFFSSASLRIVLAILFFSSNFNWIIGHNPLFPIICTIVFLQKSDHVDGFLSMKCIEIHAFSKNERTKSEQEWARAWKKCTIRKWFYKMHTRTQTHWVSYSLTRRTSQINIELDTYCISTGTEQTNEWRQIVYDGWNINAPIHVHRKQGIFRSDR